DPPHADLDVDLAVAAEAGAGPAGARVHGDQAGVERALDDPGGAFGRRIGVRDGIVGPPPAGGRIRNPVVGDLGVVAPALAPGGRVEGDQDVLRRTEVKGV